MPAPFLYDAKGDAASPYGKVWRDKVTQKVARLGITSTITITADAGWLATQRGVTDAQDVEIYSGNTAKNYNDTYQLNVGTDATCGGRW